MKRELFLCCICGKVDKGFGNNPDGAVWLDPETKEPTVGKFDYDDRCCDECNNTYVIPGRIYLIRHPEINND